MAARVTSSSEILKKSALLISGAVFLYQANQGNIVKAALVPILGLATTAVGAYFNLEPLKAAGPYILFGSSLLAPGAFVRYGIQAELGGTLTAKIVGAVALVGVTYKVVVLFMNFMGGSSAAPGATG